MTILRLIGVGDGAVGLILPAELLARQNWKVGDSIVLSETPQGFSLSSPDAEFEEQLKIGREIMRERWEVLRALAKSDMHDPS